MVSRVTRLCIAGLLWLGAGLMLLVRGILYGADDVERRGFGHAALLVGAGLVVGVVKGLAVLTKSAKRSIRYIESRPAMDSAFRSFHPIFYIVIPVMITMGLLVRHFWRETHPGVVAAVYVGIGAALVSSARIFLLRAKVVSSGSA